MEKTNKPKIKTMDIILLIVGLMLITFTVVMIWIFRQQGAIPDTLCTCVFSALGGECGVMAWIKVAKEKSSINNQLNNYNAAEYNADRYVT